MQAPIACIHNPAAGNERELGPASLVPAARPRRVAVVGGGPAGMRAALTARQRGHEVTLFERTHELGGQIRLWSQAESRRELLGIVDWLQAQVERAAVNVRMQTVATEEMLRDGDFGAVIVATGASGLRHGWTPLRPERWPGPALPGAEQAHVYSYMEALRETRRLGEIVLVYDALGGRQAAVVTEYLARSGHDVRFATWLAQPCPDLGGSRDWAKTYGMLRRLGVTFATDLELVAIGADAATLRDVYTGALHTEDADAVVLVLGAASEDRLFHALAPRRAEGLALHLIGDALAPRRADAAIREGEIAARAV